MDYELEVLMVEFQQSWSAPFTSMSSLERDRTKRGFELLLSSTQMARLSTFMAVLFRERCLLPTLWSELSNFIDPEHPIGVSR
ncbi:hypothetical protein STEG23_003670 [Scotinomys teguina]